MAKSLEALFGYSTATLLKNAGLADADSVSGASDEDILEIVGIGPTTLQVIRSALSGAKEVSEVVEKETYKKPPPILPSLDRRRIRYMLFRIKRGTVDTLDRDLRIHASVLEEHFKRELRNAGFSWVGFTFTWDISPSNPYKVIPNDVYVWVKEGGSFEGRPSGMDRAQWAKHVLATLLQNKSQPLVPYEPAAFTRQA